jgi:hypothetical protein
MTFISRGVYIWHCHPLAWHGVHCTEGAILSEGEEIYRRRVVASCGFFVQCFAIAGPALFVREPLAIFCQGLKMFPVGPGVDYTLGQWRYRQPDIRICHCWACLASLHLSYAPSSLPTTFH